MWGQYAGFVHDVGQGVAEQSSKGFSTGRVCVFELVLFCRPLCALSSVHEGGCLVPECPSPKLALSCPNPCYCWSCCVPDLLLRCSFLESFYCARWSYFMVPCMIASSVVNLGAASIVTVVSGPNVTDWGLLRAELGWIESAWPSRASRLLEGRGWSGLAWLSESAGPKDSGRVMAAANPTKLRGSHRGHVIPRHPRCGRNCWPGRPPPRRNQPPTVRSDSCETVHEDCARRARTCHAPPRQPCQREPLGDAPRVDCGTLAPPFLPLLRGPFPLRRWQNLRTRQSPGA